MSIREQVLKLLEENRGNFILGEELAEALKISRTSIWKAIKTLKEEGYKIEAFPQKGYCLNCEPDRLSASGIHLFLNDYFKNYNLKVLKTVDSTNQEGKRILLEGGGEDPLIVLSEEQTEGRGRRGRDFFSPDMTGIYMSIVLKPDQVPRDALLITVASAVGISRAIKKITDIDVEIKWVNDIYYKERKIAGILAEGLTNLETGILDYLIVGIGLNFIKPQKGFPEAFEEIAGALFSKKPENLTRNQLVAGIINEVLFILDDRGDHSFIEEYRKRSMIIGEKIEILRFNERSLAKAIGIDEKGGLMVENEKGDFETLYSGEISIKRIEK